MVSKLEDQMLEIRELVREMEEENMEAIFEKSDEMISAIATTMQKNRIKWIALSNG